MTEENQHIEEGDLREVKLAKLAALQAAGLDPWAQVRYDCTACASDVVNNFDELEGKEVAVAGRIMARRVHGKAGFADLQEESGRVQLYFKKDTIGDDSFERYSALDLGDIIGAKGTVFKTRTGQVSIEVREWVVLSKIIETLPEKFHGLTDVEQRYRQRYVDLIMNREVMERMTLRSRALSETRRFLDARGFLEVETPLLHAIAGGATAEPFVTHWNVLKADYYLRIAIELHLKRLIVGGFERVYEIGRVFRNEGLSTRHNPEFTMLELYWAYVDYEDIMRLTEELIVHLVENVFSTVGTQLAASDQHDAATADAASSVPTASAYTVQFGEYTLNFTPPFRRLSFEEAMVTHAGVSLTELRNLEQVRAVAARIGVPLAKDKGFEASLDEIFKEKVEPHLVQPTFIYDYPKGLSPLAKSMSLADKRARGYDESLELCYRFELFMATMEVANAFSELNDPLDQRQRFEEQIHERVRHYRQRVDGLEESIEEDEDGLEAAYIKGTTEIGKLVSWHFTVVETEEEGRQMLSQIDLRAIVLLLYIVRMYVSFGLSSNFYLNIHSLRPLLETICSQNPKISEFDSIRQALEETRLDQQTDEDFLTALEFAMPPTGGLGIGIDRLMMMLSGTEAIREVILFPQLRKG